MNKRKKKIVRAAALYGMILASGYFIWQSILDFSVYLKLQSEIKANTVLLEQTKQQQEDLETTRKNLTNPDYLEFIARGKYHVSRQGEQVFVFPSLSSEE